MNDRMIRYVAATGDTLSDMRQNLLDSAEGQALHDAGDMMLVWVNEGDITTHNFNVQMTAVVSKQGDTDV